MASHTDAEERVQEQLSDLNNDEAYCLTAEDAEALNNAGYATKAGHWIVLHIDDFSQSHWIVDNLTFFNTEDEANEYAEEISRDSFE